MESFSEMALAHSLRRVEDHFPVAAKVVAAAAAAADGDCSGEYSEEWLVELCMSKLEK